MTFDFTCPGCGATLAADETEIGEIVTCPGCDSQIVAESSTFPESSSASAIKIRPELIPVSTTSPPAQFTVVAPISFSIGTRGGMRSEFDRHKLQHAHKIGKARNRGQISKSASLGQSVSSLGLSGEGELVGRIQHAGATFSSDDLEIAFLIATAQLQLRASYLRANAIYGLKWDIDFDSNGNVLNFVGTAYGTAMIV